jgi:hypothetical protein
VNAALEEYIKRRRQQELLSLFGKRSTMSLVTITDGSVKPNEHE